MDQAPPSSSFFTASANFAMSLSALRLMMLCPRVASLPRTSTEATKDSCVRLALFFQGDVQIYLQVAADLVVAAGCPGLDPLLRLVLQHFDRDRESDLERTHSGHHLGVVELSRLDGRGFLAAGDAGDQPVHVPQKIPGGVSGDADVDAVLEIHNGVLSRIPTATSSALVEALEHLEFLGQVGLEPLLDPVLDLADPFRLMPYRSPISRSVNGCSASRRSRKTTRSLSFRPSPKVLSRSLMAWRYSSSAAALPAWDCRP